VLTKWSQSVQHGLKMNKKYTKNQWQTSPQNMGWFIVVYRRGKWSRNPRNYQFYLRKTCDSMRMAVVALGSKKPPNETISGAKTVQKQSKQTC
jgi:hypothetical protein